MNSRTTSRNQLGDEFKVSLCNKQSRHPVDESQLVAAARSVLAGSTFTSAAVSLAVVDDGTIHELNRRFLNHDWATDVLSFVFDERDSHLEGEVIISADTAAQSANEIGWPAEAEQLLYVAHGMLHLIGYRDKSAAELKEMRAAEAAVLEQFGFRQPDRSRVGRGHRAPTLGTRGATAR